MTRTRVGLRPKAIKALSPTTCEKLNSANGHVSELGSGSYPVKLVRDAELEDPARLCLDP